MLRPRKKWLSAFQNSLSGKLTTELPKLSVREIEPCWTGKPADLWQRLEHHWYAGLAVSVEDRPICAIETDISDFEQRNNVKLPADFREYLLRLSGIEEDPDLFCFWPLSRLAPPDSPAFISVELDRFFVFADYLIESQYYAIYLGDDPLLQNRVVSPDVSNKRVIATSFSEFIQLYLIDSPRLYGN
jgi:SMI1 / KNR4 family (SUKH-1)